MKFLLPVIIIVMSFTPAAKKHIIFFGDSITQLGTNTGGYIKRMDSMCAAQGQAANFQFTGAGIGGNKVYDLYLRMETDVLDKNPDVVVIYIGVNDVWHKTLLGTGTDAEKFSTFYQAIIDRLKARNISTILCTPAVIGEKTDCTNPQDGDLNQYSNIIRGLAAANKLPLVDLRKAFLEYNLKNNPDNKDKGILTTDRVHLNAAGNQLVAEMFLTAIMALNQ